VTTAQENTTSGTGGVDDDADGTAAHELRAGTISGIGAYVMWGFLTIYWKQLEHFGAFDLIGWRIVAASATVTVMLVKPWRRGASGFARLVSTVRDRRLAMRVVAASVLLTVNWTSYVWAVVHGHVIETALGYFISPLGAMLIGVVVFGEHLRRAQQLAVVLALAAIVVLTVSYGRVPVLALMIAISWSIYGWIKKRLPLTPLESMSAESYTLLVPALVLLVVVSRHSSSVWHAADGWHVALVALSGVATVVR
jgi:chloramphenicol-sensitive protein RarD